MPRYIILDSNCFINAINKRNTNLDFAGIKEYAKINNAYITISAFSLYELVQGLSRVRDIRLFREQLIDFGDFWVLGNNVLDHKGIEYGLDFLFLLSLNDDNNLREFGEKRKKLRADVYDVMFGKMFFYAVLVTTAYVFLSECDEVGYINRDTYFKMDYLFNHFFEEYKQRYLLIFNNVYEHAGLHSYDPVQHEFYIDYDAKNELRTNMINLFVQMLAAAEVELTLAKKEWEYSSEKYDAKMIEWCRKYSKIIKPEYFRKTAVNAKNRTHGKLTIESVLDDLMLVYPESLKKECYHFMVEKLYNSGGFGKRLNNDFIDFSNLVLIERFMPGEAVYLTEDKDWLELMSRNTNNRFVIDSINFYNHYSTIQLSTAS